MARQENAPTNPLTMGNIAIIKFSQSTHHKRHANMLGADVVQCNQYKMGVGGNTRISKKLFSMGASVTI
jgi:hypothetical protein